LTYDAGGRLLTTTSETDQALPGQTIDGVIDYRTESTLEYDADGNVVRQVSTAGQTGFPASTYVVTSQYDSQGNLVSQTGVLDGNSDGTTDTQVDLAYSYNSRGQLVEAVTKVDNDGDGAFDSTSVTTVVYDGVKS
jgi:YD repeat-containing protein